MGVYIKGMTLEQVEILLDMIGGQPLGEQFKGNCIEVPEPHGRLIDVKPFIEDYKNCEKHNCIDCMAAFHG